MQTFFMNIWASFVNLVHGSTFITYAFGMNEGLWMHVFGCAILARIFRMKFSFWKTFFIIVGIAITWEIVEIYLETPTMDAILSIYGSFARYLYDTAGDIVAGGIIALIANWEPRFPFQRLTPKKETAAPTV